MSKDEQNINLLNNYNVKCLIVPMELEESVIEKLEFPVIRIDENLLEKFDNIKAIKIDYIEERIKDTKRAGLIGWLKGYRKRKD